MLNRYHVAVTLAIIAGAILALRRRFPGWLMFTLLLAACSPTSEATVPSECAAFDAGAFCPEGFVDNCLPTSAIIGACCYTNDDGQSTAIGICSDAGNP